MVHLEGFASTASQDPRLADPRLQPHRGRTGDPLSRFSALRIAPIAP